jgi:hypothetical protein
MNLDGAMAAVAALLFGLGLASAFVEGTAQLGAIATQAGLIALALALLGHIVDRARHD